MGYLFIGLLLYLAFRFITGFVIPVVRATSQVRRQFDSMRNQNSANDAAQGHSQGSQTHPSPKPKFDVEGEYIPFEEVK